MSRRQTAEFGPIGQGAAEPSAPAAAAAAAAAAEKYIQIDMYLRGAE
jgi:hypothetical protein